MKKVWMYIGAGCVAIASLAASSWALQDQKTLFPERATAIFVHRIERRLNLTDDQRAQIRNILATERPTILVLARKVQQQQQELRSHDGFDESYVRSFAEEHKATAIDALVERVRTEILQVLTPGQRAQAEQLRQEIASRSMTRLATLGDQL
jgi:Spy/CpxP family protein refolding chaperone